MPRRKKQKSLAKVTYLPSDEAASQIQAARSSKPFPLIVVTTDASGGGDCSGTAAILRKINASGEFDSCKILLGRYDWDESSAAEIGAISLGCKGLSKENEDLKEYTVLIISDCQVALNFFDLSNGSSLREVLVDAREWMRSFEVVCERAKEVFITKVRSNHTKQSGFFDHEATDLLSSKARNQECLDKHAKENTQWYSEVPPIDEVSIAWLRDSNNETKRRKGGSGERKKRCKLRIRTDLNITWFSE